MSDPTRAPAATGTTPPPSTGPSVLAGLVGGLLAVTFMFSYSAVVLTGDLEPYVPRLTGHFLLGGAIIALIIGLSSRFSGVVALPQDNPTAVLAVIVVSVTASSEVDVTTDELFTSIVVIISISTLVGAILFWLVGRFRLAVLAQYVPYPVVAGFLAATGWLLVKGSVGVMSGVTFELGELDNLRSVIDLLIPGIAFAVLLLAAGKLSNNVMLMPAIIVGSIGAFYAILWFSGASLDSAIAHGWLLEPFGGGMLLEPISLGDVEWSIVAGEVTGLGTVLVIAVISVLLNITALSSALGEEVDVDREVRLLGYANVPAGLGGSLIGYHYVSLSTLGRRMRGGGPTVAVIVAVMCLAAMTVAAPALSYVPRFVLGGMVLFIGLGFLDDWLLQSIKKLSKGDLVVIAVILAVVELVGFIEGVAIGLVATIILFIITYSKISVIRHSFSGRELRSTVERRTSQQAQLEALRSGVLLLKLHGFVFFASTVGLLEEVNTHLDADTPPTHLILDFEHVNGLDTSALHGLSKLKSLASDRDVALLYCSVPESIIAQFSEQSFLDGNATVELTFESSDEALEWCEDDLLRRAGLNQSPDELTFDYVLRAMLDSEAEMEIFRSVLETVEIDAGQTLSAVGEQHQSLDIVESGHVEVLARNGARLRRAGPGSLLGVAGFFRPGRQESVATVRAIEPCSIRRLTKDAYLDLIDDHPEVASEIQRYALVVLSDRFQANLSTLERVLRETS